ncbi:MAG: flagellar biosynthetic protein FliR [Gemmobacter sp.]|uniref:flagellar biosynthetic protein FliR n=1 Tax=Gemmobacter sp. TaxID=1898957 RepID=UPI001A386C72|nr:flagellar biosynthetic protein FliR [Gemmobacter sp.]MBL8561431.1 flagellar biosynthetic protein FliR [Gemmobacter sp.]
MTDLLTRLTELAQLSEPAMLAFLFVFVRVAATVSLLPAFGESSVPARVKLAIALCFTMIVGPAIPPVDPKFTVLHLIGEAAIGLMLGLGLRMFIFALQTAGAIIAQSISLSQLFGATGDPQPVVGNFLTLAALAVAVSAGLHVRAAELMILSYELLPPGDGLPAPDLARWGIAQVSRMFTLGFALSAPFVIASFLYNVAIGIINRAMPQLMVSMVGAPAITLGGIALFAIASPLMLQIWLTALDTFLASPLRGLP